MLCGSFHHLSSLISVSCLFEPVLVSKKPKCATDNNFDNDDIYGETCCVPSMKIFQSLKVFLYYILLANVGCSVPEMGG